jgi:protein-tyrosine phosphatase
MKILMVCLGNICRSPIAHGVMDDLVKKEGLDWEIDSAGTGGYHIGQQPDLRSIAAAKKHGIDISFQKARKFIAADFKLFDQIFVMDHNNYSAVVSLTDQAHERAKVKLFIPDTPVQDPYFDDALFDPVFEQITTQCEQLLKNLKEYYR